MRAAMNALRAQEAAKSAAAAAATTASSTFGDTVVDTPSLAAPSVAAPAEAAPAHAAAAGAYTAVGGVATALFMKRKALAIKQRLGARGAQRMVELGSHVPGAVAGLPLRDLLHTLYKHRRDRLISDGVLHVLMLGLLLFIILEEYDVQNAAETNQALSNIFLYGNMPDQTWEKSWALGNIGVEADFTEWLEFVALPSIYGFTAPQPAVNLTTDDHEDDSNPLQPTPANVTPVYMAYQLRLVGGVRLRQVRVSPYSCAANMKRLPSRLESYTGTCYGEYSPAAEEKTPFGPWNHPTRYTWTSGLSTLQGLYGWSPGGFNGYGQGGYVIFLPAAAGGDFANNALNELMADQWINGSTRAVSLDFNLYNSATTAVSVCQFVFEYRPSGYGSPNFRIFTFNLGTSNNQLQFALIGAEAAFCALILLRIAKFLTPVRWALRTLLLTGNEEPLRELGSSMALWFDALEISVNVTVAVMWWTFLSLPLVATFDVNAATYTDLIEVATLHTNMVSMGGMAIAVSSLKLFRYLSLDSRMTILWGTLEKAAGELMAIMLTVFILITGFAFLGTMLFGADLPAFHSIEASISTLFQMAAGSFNYAPMAIVRPEVTGIFFGVYMISIYLIAFNVIVGALTTYYQDVHNGVRIEGKWKMSAVTLEQQFIARTLLLVLHPRLWWRAFRLLVLDRGCCSSMYGTGAHAAASGSPAAGAGAAESKSSADAAAQAHRTAVTLAADDNMSTTTLQVNPIGPAVASTMSPVQRALAEKAAASRSSAALAAVVANAPSPPTCWGLCCGRASDDGRAASSASMVETEVELWAREAHFQRALLEVYHDGKRRRAFDLFEYLEEITRRVDGWDTLYVSMHEICNLTNPLPCKAGSHFAATCPSRRLVDAFAALKGVTMVGGMSGAQKHVPSRVYAAEEAARFACFTVSKLNNLGMVQRRSMIVDSDQFVIVDLDPMGRVCKKVPLVQLLQMEMPMADPRRITLTFTSTGAHVRSVGNSGEDHAVYKLLETVWCLICDTALQRQQLHAEILRVLACMPLYLSGSGTAPDAHPPTGSFAVRDAKAPMLGATGRPRGSVHHFLAAHNIAVGSPELGHAATASGVRLSTDVPIAPGKAAAPSAIALATMVRLQSRVRTSSITSRVLHSAREAFQRAAQLTAAVVNVRNPTEASPDAAEAPLLPAVQPIAARKVGGLRDAIFMTASQRSASTFAAPSAAPSVAPSAVPSAVPSAAPTAALSASGLASAASSAAPTSLFAVDKRTRFSWQHALDAVPDSSVSQRILTRPADASEAETETLEGAEGLHGDANVAPFAAAVEVDAPRQAQKSALRGLNGGPGLGARQVSFGRANVRLI